MHTLIFAPFVIAGLAAKIINKRRSHSSDDVSELNVILNSLIISNAQLDGGLDDFFSEQSEKSSA
jgi:hypothetical protein